MFVNDSSIRKSVSTENITIHKSKNKYKRSSSVTQITEDKSVANTSHVIFQGSTHIRRLSSTESTIIEIQGDEGDAAKSSSIASKTIHKKSTKQLEKYKKDPDFINKLVSSGLTEKDILHLIQSSHQKSPFGHSTFIPLEDRTILTYSGKKGGKTTRSLHLLFKQLAVGGSGVVSTLISFGEDRQLVSKIALQGQDKEAIQREIRLLRQLKHDCVQAPPHSVISREGEVEGFISPRYEMDGNGLIDHGLASHPEKQRIQQESIARLSQGMLHIWEKGYLHKDHKLANTFYSRESGMVVADLGADQSLSEFYSDAEQCLVLRNQYLKDNSIEAGDAYDKIWREKIIGLQTQALTCGEDVDVMTELLRPREKGRSVAVADPKSYIASKKAELKNLQEKMIVYSHGLLALSLLLTTKDSDLHEGFPSLFYSPKESSTGYVKLREDVDIHKFRGFIQANNPAISEAQVTLLFNSLKTDYRERPTLKDFAAAFPVSTKK